MKKIIKRISGAFCALMFLFCLIIKTNALPAVSQMQSDDFSLERNNLIIDNVVASSVTVNKKGNIIDVYSDITEPRTGSKTTQDFIEYNWFVEMIDNPSPATAVVILSENTSNSSFSVTYDKVGTYNGKPIGAVVTISDYILSNHVYGTETILQFQFTNSLANGIWSRGVAHYKETIDFFYIDDASKNPINLEHAYITIASLNDRKYQNNPATDSDESVYFDSSQISSIEEVYFANPTNLDVTGNLKGKYVFGVSPTNNDFEDWWGSPTFSKNAVTFKVNGQFSFYNDSSGTVDLWRSYWMTISSAPISSIKAKNPVKYVLDSNGNRKERTSYSVGDQFDFEIDQQVHKLQVDIITRYSSFSIVDKLPKEVDYVGAKLYLGNAEVTEGTINYDNNAHTVTWTANQDFLDNMPLEGETYTLRVTVKANSGLTKEVKNSAHSVFNNSKFNSNEAAVIPIESVKVPATDAFISLIISCIASLLILIGITGYYFANKRKTA